LAKKENKMKIIFKNEDNSIGIITPTAEALSKYTYKQIAEKDVPHNLPYVIVEDSYIPTDRTFRECWELPEDTKFDGVGSISNEFKE
jgi:hypothetical protein